MKKVFRGFALLVTILLLQLTIFPANEAFSDQQQDVHLKELNIKVMPEFINPENWDNNVPSLLVGYHGTVVNNTDTKYTGEIKISVPTKDPKFQAGFVAQFKDEEDSEPTEEEYTVNVEEGFISWIPKNSIGPNEEYKFVLEYFTAPIEGVVDRNFTFEYIPESDIANVNLAVYAPYKAQNFKIDKETDLNSMTFGLEFFIYEYENLKQGEVYDLKVSYSKDNIVTTMEALNDFSAPNDENHAGFGGGEKPAEAETVIEKDSNAENLVLIILTVVVAGGLVFLIVRKKKAPVEPKEKGLVTKKIVNKEEEIKKLRKMLADGLIDEKTYKEKRSKLD